MRSKSKILSPIALERRFKKKRPKQLVFANGCFDILHRGHVETLERARALGAALVVAINADDSVRKLKGPTRPVNSLQDRMRVMAALECVDFVTWFTEETPRDLICRLRPAIIVKGGDYDAAQVVGAQEAKAWGGRVKIVPLVEGHSTTGIINRTANPAG